MGCRTGGNQNCRDSRLKRFRTGGMQEKGFGKGGSQERRNGKEGCRKGGIQERMDTGQEGGRKRTNAGQEGYMTRGMQERGIQERRDAERKESRLEGYRKGWFRTVEIWNGRDARVDRRDKGKLGGRTGGMQDRMELEPEGFRTGEIQDWRDAGKGDSGKEEGRKGGM